MRDRIAKRIEEQKEVTLKDNEHTIVCQMVDISRNGISVLTPHFFPTYREVAVIVPIEGRTVEMRGIVRWSTECRRQGQKTNKVGIMIKEPPVEFLDYVKTRSG